MNKLLPFLAFSILFLIPLGAQNAFAGSSVPIITCPADVTIEVGASTDPSNTGTAIATDDSSVPVITFSDVNSLNPDGTGTIDRTWTATDDQSQSSSCLQNILIVDTTPPGISCPAGYSLNPNTAFCEKEPDVICPAGTILNTSNGQCESVPDCPSGFSLNLTTDLCEASEDPTCPADTVYNPTSDECESAPTCPAGTTFNPTSDECESIPTCPAGTIYNLTNDQCEAPAATTCPTGTTLNAAGTACEDTPSCPAGTNLNGAGSLCAIPPSCPFLTFLNPVSDICSGSPPPGVSICPAGTTLDSTGTTCEGPPMCIANTAYNPVSNECESAPSCPAGTTLSGGVCSGPTILACPAGLTLNAAGTACEDTPSCTAGTTLNAAGTACEDTPSCPFLTSLNPVSDICSGSLPPGPSICPAGTILDFSGTTCEGPPICIANTVYNSVSNECESTPTCPAGTTLSGGVCDGGPAGNCPTGTTPNPNTQTCDASATCPVDTTLNPTSDQCDATPTCPVDTTLNTTSDQCDATPTCPVAGTLLNTVTELCEGDAPPICPVRTMYNAGTCEGSTFLSCDIGTSVIGTCQSGTDYSAESCMAVCVTPNILSCPSESSPPAGTTTEDIDNDGFANTCDTDDDNDNILDTVDDMQTDFSDTFSDGATTSGEIDDRGDQEDELTISDEADPEGVGFDVAAGGGPTSAIVIACNSLANLSLNSGDSGTITCGSVTVSVTTGSVDVQFNTGSGPATTTMGATDSLTFDGTLTFTNNSLTTPAVITIGGRTFTLAPGETLTITFPSSKVSYQDPNLGDVRHGEGHDNGFCMNQNCINVDGFFNHFPEKIVPQGSTQTFSLLINCPRGVNTCNHASIEGVLPDSDFYEEQWGVTLDRQVRSDEWDMTVNNPYGEIGEVTTSVQEVDQSFLSVSFNIEFLIPGSIGTADGLRVAHENNRFLHVTVWDSYRGISNYIFNEGVYVDDIYAYPKVEASYDVPLEIEKLCLNENTNKRYTCAFDKVRDWTIQNAEKALLEIKGITELDVLNEEFLSKFKELKQAIADDDSEKILELQAHLDELGTKIHNLKQ